MQVNDPIEADTAALISMQSLNEKSIEYHVRKVNKAIKKAAKRGMTCTEVCLNKWYQDYDYAIQPELFLKIGNYYLQRGYDVSGFNPHIKLDWSKHCHLTTE